MNILERLHTVGKNAGLVQGFDSIETDALKNAANQLSSSELREQQSVVEHARQLALLIVSDLVSAITDDQLDENELASGRLDDLLLEATEGADDDENMLFDLVVGSVSDAFETLGVDESVINEVFSDNVEAADAALESAANTVLANLPDDGEPMDDFVREFIFGGDEDEAGFDSISKAKVKAKAGALSMKKRGGKNIAYRGVVAIRQGKKTIVNKRLPNQKVRLSAAQKTAVKKARLKSTSANAIKKRVLSLKKGHRMGLYKGLK